MPRGKKEVPGEREQRDQNALWWAQTGKRLEHPLHGWDCDTAVVLQAILELLSAGNTVCIRPGSGGESLGIAIWEPVNKRPYVWFGADVELDDWARGLTQAAAAYRAKLEGNEAR